MDSQHRLPVIGEEFERTPNRAGKRTISEVVRVAILTSTFRLEGDLHVSPGARVLDEVNKAKGFLPLTNAQLYSMRDNTPVDTRKFIAVNKTHIVMISPVSSGSKE